MPHSKFFKCFEPRKAKNNFHKPNTPIHIIRPTGLWFINGVSKEYDDSFPEPINDYISAEEWNKVMNKINDCGITYFPCFPALVIGYLLSLLTCCISMFIPLCCACDMVE